MSNVIFQPPPGLAWSVTKRPKYSTLVQTPISARGQLRIARQQYPIWEYEMVWEYLKGGEQTGISTSSNADNSYQQLLGFFMARQGGYGSFLYSDPNDNQVAQEQFATGDGSSTAFQLTRNIGDGVDIVQNVDASVLNPTIYRYDFQSPVNFCYNSEHIENWAVSHGAGDLNPNVTAGFPAPDGSNNAVKIVAYATTNETYVDQDCLIVPFNGEQYTFSCWLRADSAQTFHLRVVQNTGQNDIVVPVNVTTQWQRFSFTATIAGAGTGNLRARMGTFNGANTQRSVYAWGAQVERSAAATAYIKTGLPQSVPWGPTVQYSTSRTNLGFISEQVGSWGLNTGVSGTDNFTTAPNGNNTATKMVYNGTGLAGNYRFYQNTAVAVMASGNKYIGAVWLRCDVGTTLNLAIGMNGTGVTPITVTSRWTRFVTPVVTGDGLSALQMVIYSPAAVNSSFTVYAWGGQIEGGTTATPSITPYIKTPTSASVTVTDYSLGSTGLTTFASAPASGAFLSWTGSYYYRLRFLDDSVDFEEFMYQFWQCRSVRFESVIL